MFEFLGSLFTGGGVDGKGGGGIVGDVVGLFSKGNSGGGSSGTVMNLPPPNVTVFDTMAKMAKMAGVDAESREDVSGFLFDPSEFGYGAGVNVSEKINEFLGGATRDARNVNVQTSLSLKNPLLLAGIAALLIYIAKR